MKWILIFLVSFYTPKVFCQCKDIQMGDPSFEAGTYNTGIFPYSVGFWYQDDGCDLNGNLAYHGDTSACSNGGGAFQIISVEPHYLLFELLC